MREIARSGDDDVGRLVGLPRAAGPSSKRCAGQPCAEAVDARGFRHEWGQPAPVLDMRGGAPHRDVWAREILNELLDRLLIALFEHGAGTLAMIREDNETVRPRCVGSRFLDETDDAIQPRYRIARLHPGRAGVVGDLVVVDEIDVDRARSAVHLFDHQCGAQVT